MGPGSTPYVYTDTHRHTHKHTKFFLVNNFSKITSYMLKVSNCLVVYWQDLGSLVLLLGLSHSPAIQSSPNKRLDDTSVEFYNLFLKHFLIVCKKNFLVWWSCQNFKEFLKKSLSVLHMLIRSLSRDFEVSRDC